MWKSKLGLVKSAISTIVLFLSLIALLIPIYGFWTNTLNEFSRGLVVGAILVVAVVIVTRIIFDFWKLDIDSAVEVVIQRLQKKETAARLGRIGILDREFMQKENYWKITGDITFEKDYLTFEVWVDALTGSTKKFKVESPSLPIGAYRD